MANLLLTIATSTTIGLTLALDGHGKPLPIPADMYRGQCPFQMWYDALPDNFNHWETDVLEKYEKAWLKAGAPTGIRKNDHDYDTSLGQGNTLGFLAARLTFLEDVPAYIKHGLFAQSGTVPAVVRFSDFGADSSTLRLARMAVKVPLSSAWAGEANLLFTETMDSFPLADYNDLAMFAGDESLPWYKRIWDNIEMASHAIGVGIKDGIEVYQALKVEALAKSYYSQVPYMLGHALAMKFQLIPQQKTCGERGADPVCCLPATSMPSASEAPFWANARASVTSSYLSKCDAVFELQLQVQSFDANKDTILHGASVSWNVEPIAVATLTIPKQQTISTLAVGTKLRSSLAATLGVQADGVDKMFAFHPIENHESNRPVGDINTFRAAFYSQNTQERFNTIHKGAFKNATGQSLTTVKQVPFDALQAAGVFNETANQVSAFMLKDDVHVFETVV